jgi:threonine synthase
MAYLVSRAWSEGRKELVISSSGNAAISAASYCRLAQIKLHAFISKKIPEGKLEALSASGTILHFSPRPVSEAVKFASQKGLLNLRPSQNPFGSEGYQTIAFEILESLGMIEDIFVPVSSGSALLGIALGFQKFGLMPRLHLCQSTAICPLARLFDSNYEEEEESLAKALVARAVPLKSQLVKFVKGSEGSGWVISNEEIKKAQLQLKEKEIETSAEGALALAAHNKAKKAGFNLGKTVVLLTGKKY